MKHYRLTQDALGQRIGKTKGYVSMMINDKEPITTSVIEGLVKSFPRLNINWLLVGVGEMFLVENGDVVSEPEVRYEAKPADPLGSLRELLEWHDARIKRLEEEVRLLRGEE